MAPFFIVIAALVALLCVLIAWINHGAHFAPQAYYRRKAVGAPVAFERDALGPRLRRTVPEPPQDRA